MSPLSSRKRAMFRYVGDGGTQPASPTFYALSSGASLLTLTVTDSGVYCPISDLRIARSGSVWIRHYMMESRLSSSVRGALIASISLLSACPGNDIVPCRASGCVQSILFPLDSTVVIDVQESIVGKNRSLMLNGITKRQYGAPYSYIDAQVSVQPATMIVSINGVRHINQAEDVIQGGAEFTVPIDKLLTTAAMPSTDGNKFRLYLRYGDRTDTYTAWITSGTVTVTPVQIFGLSEVKTPTWQRTPDALLWYYAIKWNSSSGYLGEVTPDLVQPLNDYLVNAGAQPWALPTGYYKNLDLYVDDQGVAQLPGNRAAPLHRAYTFFYDGDFAGLNMQLRQVEFPAPQPWIYYLNSH